MRAASFPQATQQWGNTVITAPFTQKAYFKQNNLTHLCAATALHDIIWQMSKRKITAIRSKYGGYFNQKRKKKKDELNVVIQTRILTAKRTRTTSLVFFFIKASRGSSKSLGSYTSHRKNGIFYFLPSLLKHQIHTKAEGTDLLWHHVIPALQLFSEDPLRRPNLSILQGRREMLKWKWMETKKRTTPEE